MRSSCLFQLYEINLRQYYLIYLNMKNWCNLEKGGIKRRRFKQYGYVSPSVICHVFMKVTSFPSNLFTSLRHPHNYYFQRRVVSKTRVLKIKVFLNVVDLIFWHVSFMELDQDITFVTFFIYFNLELLWSGINV